MLRDPDTALTAGALAYIDSFAGLIPCKVEAPADADGAVQVAVTADRPGWPRGERHTLADGHVVARDRVHLRSGVYRIAAVPRHRR